MEIDFGKVRQKKVKKFLWNQGLTNVSNFMELQSVCYDPAVEVTYHKHHQTFIIKKDIESVWNIYKTIHPKEAWNGEMVSFGVQYSRNHNSIHYLDDPYPGMKKGQIIILNLKMFWGLLHLAVAHEIAEVDDLHRIIKMCYMKGGASEGSQWITFHETPEGFTQVSHMTLYKSKSTFRDTKLYPRFHSRAITEFHNNIKRKAELLKD